MRKIFLLLLVIVLVFMIAMPVFATSARYGTKTSRPITTTGIATDADGNTMNYEVWVYGISIFASTASSYMGIYDCDTTAELLLETTYAKDEIGEATQYDTAEKKYSPPKYFADGIGIIIPVGTGFVEYGPPPSN